MKSNITPKQLLVFLIFSTGLYYSGQNVKIMVTEMASISSFLDVLNVMIFFTCCFPFLILSLRLSKKIIKNLFSFLKFASYSIQAAIF
jgi:hypothetical protein